MEVVVQGFHFCFVVIGYLFYLRNYKLALTQTFTEEPQDFRFVHCPEIKIIISYFYKKNNYLLLLKMNGLFLIHFYNLRFFMQFAFLHFLNNIIIYFAIFFSILFHIFVIFQIVILCFIYLNI